MSDAMRVVRCAVVLLRSTQFVFLLNNTVASRLEVLDCRLKQWHLEVNCTKYVFIANCTCNYIGLV